MKFYDFALREGKYGVWLYMYVKVDHIICVDVGMERIALVVYVCSSAILRVRVDWLILSWIP